MRGKFNKKKGVVKIISRVFLRQALPVDFNDFYNLVYFASGEVLDAIFDGETHRILQILFQHTRNLFSYKHVHFIEANEKNAGLILGYDYKESKYESLNTGLLLLFGMGIRKKKIITNLLKAQMKIGSVRRGEFYISNIAVYPEFRGLGIGNKLMLNAERIARERKLRFISLDVEVDNEGAINLYKKLGYEIVGKIKVLHLSKDFKFYRMIKTL